MASFCSHYPIAHRHSSAQVPLTGKRRGRTKEQLPQLFANCISSVCPHSCPAEGAAGLCPHPAYWGNWSSWEVYRQRATKKQGGGRQYWPCRRYSYASPWPTVQRTLAAFATEDAAKCPVTAMDTRAFTTEGAVAFTVADPTGLVHRDSQ